MSLSAALHATGPAAEKHAAQDNATALQLCKGWPWFRRLVMDQIEQLRDALERDLSETDTAKARGQIKALRGMIQKVETTMPPEKITPGANHE